MIYRGLTLDTFQRQAIETLQKGESVLVAAPTGTGKTLVADWIVEDAMSKGQSVVYTAPIKALSNQKFRDYCALLGDENVGLVTGDLVIRRDAPCKVMTTEILRNMLLCGDQIEGLAAVIVDEIHFLDDPDRGTTWEEMLIYLPHPVQIVGLSATLSNLDEFASWLTAVRGHNVEVIEERKRAVPLTFRIATRETGLTTIDESRQEIKQAVQRRKSARQRAQIEELPEDAHHRGKKSRRGRGGLEQSRGSGNRGKKGRHQQRQGRGGRGGRGKFSRNRSSTSHVDVFKLMREAEHLPYLYFIFSRARTEILSKELGRWLRGSLLSAEEREIVDSQLREFAMKPGVENAMTPHLAQLYRKGIAFHHAGLNVLLKAFVEQLYEQRLIKVLYCTGTFALGINMPARAAVFDSLERYDGQGMIPLPTREFMQMAGRAGRRGLDDEGLVAIRMGIDEFADQEPQIRRYLSSSYEPVESRFSLSFNSVVNLLDRHPDERIRELVEKSFLSWRRQGIAEQKRERATQLAQELEQLGLKLPHKRLKKRQRQLKQNIRAADQILNETWREFQNRVRLLREFDYIGDDGEFYVGAKALMHFQIQEIFTTELFLAGIFDGLEPELLYGVLCAMVVELPRSVRVYDVREHRRLSKMVEGIFASPIVYHAANLSQQQVSWEAQMIPLGKAWAEGRSLADIGRMVSSETDVSGTLVGAFRRAKDLLTQLRSAWKEIPDNVAMSNALLRAVSRDEVEVVG